MSEPCPNCRTTERHLAEAYARIRQLLEAVGALIAAESYLESTKRVLLGEEAKAASWLAAQ